MFQFKIMYTQAVRYYFLLKVFIQKLQCNTTLSLWKIGENKIQMNDSEVLESSMMSQHGEMTRTLNVISCDALASLVTLPSFQGK